MKANRGIDVASEATQSMKDIVRLVEFERQLTKNPRSDRNELGIIGIQKNRKLTDFSPESEFIDKLAETPSVIRPIRQNFSDFVIDHCLFSSAFTRERRKLSSSVILRACASRCVAEPIPAASKAAISAFRVATLVP